MARNENPPFDRGSSYYNNFASSTGSTTDGVQLEGKEWMFEDFNPATKTLRSNQYVKCRVVRNTSAGVLLPSRLANLAVAPNSNGAFGGQVDGYATTLAQRAYPIDEFLPAGGVQVNDLFWIVTEGPAMVLTDLAALTGVISIGSKVVAQTAVTSGATTAGRVLLQDLTGATAPLANQAQNYVGHAMTAATTSQTNASILVNVGHW